MCWRLCEIHYHRPELVKVFGGCNMLGQYVGRLISSCQIFQSDLARSNGFFAEEVPHAKVL